MTTDTAWLSYAGPTRPDPEGACACGETDPAKLWRLVDGLSCDTCFFGTPDRAAELARAVTDPALHPAVECDRERGWWFVNVYRRSDGEALGTVGRAR